MKQHSFLFDRIFAGIIFLIPIVAILSGGMATVILLIIMTSLIIGYAIKNELPILSFELSQQTKYLLLFTGIFLLIYCFLNHDIASALKLYVRILLLLIVSFLAFGVVSNSQANFHKYLSYYSYGICAALLIAMIEYYSNAMILSFVTNLLNSDSEFNPARFLEFKINKGINFMLISIWPVIIYLISCDRKKLAIFVILLLCAVIFTGFSETAKLALLASLLSFALVIIFKEKIFKFFIPALIIINLLFILLLNNVQPQKIAEETPLMFSALHRICIWQYSLDLIKKRPLGRGMNAAENEIFSKKEGKEICVLKNDKTITVIQDIYFHISLHPHNNILQITLELGIIGLILYFLISLKIINFIRHTKFSLTQKSFMIAMFFAFFAIGSTGFDIWQNWLIATILLNIIFMRCALSKKTS